MTTWKRRMAMLLSLALLLGIFGGVSALAEEKTKVIIAGTNGVGDTQSMAHEELARRLNEMGGWDAVAMVSGEMGGTDDAMEQGMNGVGILVASDPPPPGGVQPGHRPADDALPAE